MAIGEVVSLFHSVASTDIFLGQFDLLADGSVILRSALDYEDIMSYNLTILPKMLGSLLLWEQPTL